MEALRQGSLKFNVMISCNLYMTCHPKLQEDMHVCGPFPFDLYLKGQAVRTCFIYQIVSI